MTKALIMSVIKNMKHTIPNITATVLLAFASIGSHVTLGQDTIQTTTTGPDVAVQATTTTSAGTISEFDPQTIVVRSDDAPAPVRYTYTKSTTYVDENGNPVSMETVRSGLPVTVYYVKQGDDLVASKVVVRKIVTEPPPTNVEESKTTTTTTTTSNK